MSPSRKSRLVEKPYSRPDKTSTVFIKMQQTLNQIANSIKRLVDYRKNNNPNSLLIAHELLSLIDELKKLQILRTQEPSIKQQITAKINIIGAKLKWLGESTDYAFFRIKEFLAFNAPIDWEALTKKQPDILAAYAETYEQKTTAREQPLLTKYNDSYFASDSFNTARNIISGLKDKFRTEAEAVDSESLEDLYDTIFNKNCSSKNAKEILTDVKQVSAELETADFATKEDLLPILEKLHETFTHVVWAEEKLNRSFTLEVYQAPKPAAGKLYRTSSFTAASLFCDKNLDSDSPISSLFSMPTPPPDNGSVRPN